MASKSTRPRPMRKKGAITLKEVRKAVKKVAAARRAAAKSKAE